MRQRRPPVPLAAGVCAGVMDCTSLTNYWSSTTLAGLSDYAWVVNLSGGSTNALVEGLSNLVWAVRGGE